MARQVLTTGNVGAANVTMGTASLPSSNPTSFTPLQGFEEGMCKIKLPGLPGAWSLTNYTVENSPIDPPHLRLDLIQINGESAEELRERVREQTLKEAPEDAREALRAVYDLEDAAAERGAEIQVEVVPGDRPRFRVEMIKREEEE